MKATFENSVHILVKAYLDGYLEPMSCKACAVGNLVASGMGYKYLNAWSWGDNKSAEWHYVVRAFGCDYSNYGGLAKQQIDSTGYTPEHLESIEDSFMRGDIGIFERLMSVVDQLAIIHSIDLKAKEEAKLLFVKA